MGNSSTSGRCLLKDLNLDSHESLLPLSKQKKNHKAVLILPHAIPFKTHLICKSELKREAVFCDHSIEY